MKNTLRQVKRATNWALSRIAAVLLIGMAALVVYQVFTRYVLGSPSAFTEELVRYFLIWTGFIAAAYAFGSRQHMALLFVRDRFPGVSRKVVMVFTDLLILLFALLVITIGGARLALSARLELSALLGISRGLVYAVAPLSGAFIVLIQLINIWEDAAGVELLNDEKEEVR
ncbi:TRAP transporter small permease [Propionimicrobium sp. PCR01-08-3]|uniref:TRAP transporter small permease n=1 Tax=Propionimicrobium sp. PCR01-08-3 TaxID=3052086 RepID=UPI00255C7350|nr:TRAP transporter small permease [Propionimicrobium sp. PCR01-08-3]WIY81786.1 TRAP transporter small permease [Propionimicrobium sp. PCR01-08-3]